MSIRARLALGAAAAVAIAIVLASVVVYFLVRNELRAQVDRNLQSEAHQIAQCPALPFSTYAYPPNIYSFDVPSSALHGGYFQLVGDDGRIYIPSGYLAPTPLPVNARVRAVAAGKSKGVLLRQPAPGEDTRVYTMSRIDFPPVAIQVVAQLSTIDNELARIRLWLLLVSVGGIALASGAGLLVARTTLRPVRELSETAERVRKTRDLSQRIDVDGTDELATLAPTFNAMLESLDEAAQRQRQLVSGRLARAADAADEPAHEHRGARLGGRMPPAERKQLLEDVVVQLGEMTELIGELTELARGEEQNEPLEEVRLDLLTEEAIRRATRHHPDVPIEADLDADDRGRAAGQPRARDHEPARQRGQVEPRRVAGRGAAGRRRADRPRPRPGNRRGGRPPRVRALLPRHLGARHARLGPRARDREAGRGEPRRDDRGRGAGGWRHADAAEHSRSWSGSGGDTLSSLLGAAAFLSVPSVLSLVPPQRARSQEEPHDPHRLGACHRRALVIVISSLTRGLDNAQQNALNPLSSIGTDLTVTLAPRDGEHGQQARLCAPGATAAPSAAAASAAAAGSTRRAS